MKRREIQGTPRRSTLQTPPSAFSLLTSWPLAPAWHPRPWRRLPSRRWRTPRRGAWKSRPSSWRAHWRYCKARFPGSGECSCNKRHSYWPKSNQSHENIVHQAQKHQKALCIGCEPFINGVAALLNKIDEASIENIRIFSDVIIIFIW